MLQPIDKKKSKSNKNPRVHYTNPGNRKPSPLKSPGPHTRYKHDNKSGNKSVKLNQKRALRNRVPYANENHPSHISQTTNGNNNDNNCDFVRDVTFYFRCEIRIRKPLRPVLRFVLRVSCTCLSGRCFVILPEPTV